MDYMIESLIFENEMLILKDQINIFMTESEIKKSESGVKKQINFIEKIKNAIRKFINKLKKFFTGDTETSIKELSETLPTNNNDCDPEIEKAAEEIANDCKKDISIMTENDVKKFELNVDKIIKGFKIGVKGIIKGATLWGMYLNLKGYQRWSEKYCQKMDKLKTALDKDEEMSTKEGSPVVSQESKEAMKEYDRFVKVVNPFTIIVNRLCSFLANLKFRKSKIGLTIDSIKGMKIGKMVGNKIGTNDTNKEILSSVGGIAGGLAGGLSSYNVRNYYTNHKKPWNMNQNMIQDDINMLKSRYDDQSIIDINEKTDTRYNNLLREIINI